MYASLLTPFRVMSGNEEFTIKDSNGDDLMIPCDISVPVLRGGTIQLPNGDSLWINDYMGEFTAFDTREGITIALGSGHDFGLMLLKYNPSTHVFYDTQESIYGLYDKDDMYNRGNELKIYDFDGVDYATIQKWTDEPDWIAHGAVYLGSLILQRRANAPAPAGTDIDQDDYWVYRYSMGQTVTLTSELHDHDGQQVYISPLSAVRSEVSYYFEYDTGDYLPLLFVLEAEDSQGNLQLVNETDCNWLSCNNTDITRDWKITIVGYRTSADSYDDFQQVDWHNFALIDLLHEDVDVSGYLLADGAEPAHSYGWTYTAPSAS